MGLTGCTQIKSNSSNILDNSRLRVITSGEGFFQISNQECENLGISWDNRDEIGLFHLGEPYPFWFEKDQKSGTEYLRFYSPPNPPDVNLSENVFVLSKEKSSAQRKLTPIILDSQSFDDLNISSGEYTIHLEHQNLYLPQAEIEDHRLWKILQPDQPIGQEVLFPVMPGGDIIIRFQIWNPALEISTIDQKFLISINGQEFTQEKKLTTGWQEIKVEIDNFSIKNENKIQVQYNNPLEGIPSKLYLDFIEIRFSTQIELSNSSQSFYFEDDPLILKVSSSGTLIILDGNNLPVNNYSIQKEGAYQITNPTGTYAAWIPEGEFAQVLDLSPVHEIDGNLTTDQVDYLIIAPQKFQQSLSPFISMKENQGLEVSVVSPQEIYDSINSGFPSTGAIKNFIQNMYMQSDRTLKYILLVGDYSFEIVDYDQFIEFVPSNFIEISSLGKTISDIFYTDMDMDNYPDIAIGRIPASSPDQLETWVEKLITFEKNLPAQWIQITAIVDGSDPIYEQVANNFVSSFQHQVDTNILVDPDWVDLDATFSKPSSLLVYFGHGSIDLWGKDQILSTSAVNDLSKVVAAPVIFSFTCLNGYFIHPQKLSLAEALLFQPHAGAVAMFTFTGQTLAVDQERMLSAFKSGLHSNQSSTIGGLVIESGENLFLASILNSDIVKSSIFFGDPSMKIPQNLP